ncbi:DNA alkylation repair protein [Alloprevotella tannerae]|uniref:DNA alkylation repair protein n=1 Tax=Alloprevotella tannerae TaxID=76122 RepID=UPI0028E7C7AC|nr:DNA alkylation repair protein [Alloprevotella tannerae]
MDTNEELRQIKKALRTMMNGPVSALMRRNGLHYKVNFGVELPRLEDFAKELPHTYNLAATLWKEDIRECRLLACMLMPFEVFSRDLADIWLEQVRFAEEADALAMYLLSHLPYASELAFECIAGENRMRRYIGYQLLGRLFLQRCKPSFRDSQEFLDQVASDLTSTDQRVSLAAYKALMRYMDLGLVEERMGNRILNKAMPVENE